MKNRKRSAFFEYVILLLITACSFFSSPLAAQHEQKEGKDTIVYIPKNAADKKSIKPAFDFDQRFSIIRDKRVNIWGARAGILVNEKFKVGAGAYFLKDKFKSISIDSGGSPTYYGNRNYYFGTVYFEPFLFRFKFIEMSVPLELGAGKSIFRVYDNATNLQAARTANYFIPTGAGLSLSFKLPPIGTFKPTRWFGINFLAGYRYCAFQGHLENIFPHKFETDYSGLFYSVSATIFLDRASDDIKEWKTKRKAKKSVE